MTKIHSKRKPIRKIAYKIHLYIAVTIGFMFVVLGLTGICNIFFFELEEFGLPEVRHDAHAQVRSLDEVMQIVRAAHSDKMGKWSILLPGDSNDYLWVRYPKPQETADELYAPMRVLVDPYSGKIVSASYWGRTLWTLVYEVHASLLTGKIGPDIGRIGVKTVSILGVFLFISVSIGLYLWWPRSGKFKRAVTIKRRASPERFYFDLHKSTGFYSSIILLVIAFTGFSFSYADLIKPLVRIFSSVQKKHLKEPELNSEFIDHAQRITIAQAIARADAVFPNAQLREVSTPDGKEGVFCISKRQPGEANRIWPRSKVWIDQYSGKVLAIQDPNRFTAGETFFSLMWPLHNGEAFGFAGRVLWSVVGIAPLLLYISGIKRWLQKRRAHARKRHKPHS